MHQRWMDMRKKLDYYDISAHYLLGFLLALVITLPCALIYWLHKGVASMKLKTLALIVSVLVIGLALISLYGCSKVSVKPNDNWQAELKAAQARDAAVQSAEAAAAAEAIRVQQQALADKARAGQEDVTAQYGQDALYGRVIYTTPKRAKTTNKPFIVPEGKVMANIISPSPAADAPKPASLLQKIIIGILISLGAAAGIFAVVVLLMYMADRDKPGLPPLQ